jgi:hypothetical protein
MLRWRTAHPAVTLTRWASSWRRRRSAVLTSRRRYASCRTAPQATLCQRGTLNAQSCSVASKRLKTASCGCRARCALVAPACMLTLVHAFMMAGVGMHTRIPLISSFLMCMAIERQTPEGTTRATRFDHCVITILPQERRRPRHVNRKRRCTHTRHACRILYISIVTHTHRTISNSQMFPACFATRVCVCAPLCVPYCGARSTGVRISAAVGTAVELGRALCSLSFS